MTKFTESANKDIAMNTVQGGAMAGNKIQIYQTADGKTQIDVRMEKDTLWLTLLQIAELFDRDKSVISRHLKNIFDTGELPRFELLQNLQQFKQAARKNCQRRFGHSTKMGSFKINLIDI